MQQEIVPIHKEDLFIILNHPNAKFDYPVHYHPEYEINLVMGCTGTRVVGDSEETFGPTDLVMVGPSLPHAWKSKDVTNHVITIQFSQELSQYPMLSKRIFAPIRQLLQDAENGLSFEGPEQESIKEQIISLTRMQGFQSVTAFLNILSTMANANRKRLVSGLFESDLGSSTKSRRIAKVCEYIDQNLDKDLSLAEVAALVNMSESAFSHFFKKRTGLSYINYVNNQRIAKACTLLSDTTLSASEICYDCGFNNKSNFIRIFRKKKNMTPIEYRKYIGQMLIKY
ncbi:MAG: helix-turn-helix domain-containing protein [Bacteroidales bacterium]|nr:helix-turn-helix domain-containing protein [Bacteroidales bacterium]MBR3989836.1 helix-turn-helix domain-containing protein [Bacteroidales bacterium]